MKRSEQCVCLMAALLLMAAGCAKGPESNSGGLPAATASGSEAAADVHHHPTEGPHHGHLIELGNEEYHAELVHTDSAVTIYLLDAAAKSATAIDAKELVINLKHDGQPEQFHLLAAPEAGDAEGKSSRFTIDDRELVEHLEHEASEARLSVTIHGTAYSGSLAHHHDDDGHGHDHAH